MPRKPVRPRKKRGLPEPDFKYDSVLLSRFINKLNFSGKKILAQKALYGAMDIIKDKSKEDPLKVFLAALNNIRPLVVVKARRIGGATYQVPVELPQQRGETIAMRWLISFARLRKGMPIRQKLAEEILAAYKNEGAAIKKKEDTHRMAEANKAFAHYRW